MKHVEKPMEHEGEAGAYGDLTFSLSTYLYGIEFIWILFDRGN